MLSTLYVLTIWDTWRFTLGNTKIKIKRIYRHEKKRSGWGF